MKPSWNRRAKGQKTTEKRERQWQKLVNETAEEKEILRKESWNEAYKKRSKQSKEKSILGRGLSKNAEKGDNVDCKA